MNNALRIATRSSRLALWQAEHVRERLLTEHPELCIKLIPITTTGDRILDRPLATLGGKGLFIKELEQALLEHRADIAVHSMKDVPIETPAGLDIPVILAREDARDALVAHSGTTLDDLASGAVIGTSSVRRKSQLLARRDDLRVRDLRGNVTTRLEKFRSGEFDAIVLAAAGLERLGLGGAISGVFDPAEMIPAVGQGAIGIECRTDDADTCELVAPLHDTETGIRVGAERAMSARLNGGCDIPLAAYARIDGDTLHLAGLVASIDGTRIARHECCGPAHDGQRIGRALAEALLRAGASGILADIAAHKA